MFWPGIAITEWNASEASNARHRLRHRFFGLSCRSVPFALVAQGLTTLVINTEYHQRGVLRALLGLCPQLERLEQHFATAETGRRFAIPGVSYKGDIGPTRLRHLLWSNCHDIIDDGVLVSSRCPDLTTFCFREDSVNALFEHDVLELSSVLLLLQMSCKKLTRLLVEAADGTDFEDAVDLDASSDTGLQDFVYTTLSWYEPEFLHLLLDNHSSTLEYIHINIDDDDTTFANTNTFQELPRMRRLKVSGGSRAAAHHIALFLVLCPNLRELSLDAVFAVDSLCVAVPQLHIHTFHMTLASTDTITAIVSLLHFWILARSKCSLRVMSIDASCSSSSPLTVASLLLPTLGRLPTLTSLTISTGSKVDEASMKGVTRIFVYNMKESGMAWHLHYLKIDHVEYSTSAQVQQFVASNA